MLKAPLYMAVRRDAFVFRLKPWYTSIRPVKTVRAPICETTSTPGHTGDRKDKPARTIQKMDSTRVCNLISDRVFMKVD